MREKRTLCKVQTHTHTGHKRETIYVYVEESTSKHRVLSSISAYYACRDILADTGKESIRISSAKNTPVELDEPKEKEWSLLGWILPSSYSAWKEEVA